jgi:hypothetical protein
MMDGAGRSGDGGNLLGTGLFRNAFMGGGTFQFELLASFFLLTLFRFFLLTAFRRNLFL